MSYVQIYQHKHGAYAVTKDSASSLEFKKHRDFRLVAVAANGFEAAEFLENKRLTAQRKRDTRAGADARNKE